MTMVVAISDNAHAADQAVTRLARAAFDDTVSEVILDGLSRKRISDARGGRALGRALRGDTCLRISVATQIENRFFTSTDAPRWSDRLRVQP
jgi:hypothetical protein